jgi:hypothetical protein
MENGKTKENPNPRDVKNGRNQKREEQKNEHIPEGSEEDRGKEHNGQAEVKGTGFACLLTSQGPKGLDVAAEGPNQA